MSTIPSTAVSFSSIQTVLGGTNPISMSEYFADATTGYSTNVSGIPNKFSAISVSVFKGKNKPVIYTFGSHTFTNAGNSGRSGPTLTQCRSAYSSAAWANTYLNMTTQGVQEWTVPKTASYNFIVAGARGGNVWSINGGLGRIISQNSVFLSAGTVVLLVVGQHGGNSTINAFGDSLAAGGGGGSFVYLNSITQNNCILAAGGGGGAPWNSGVASRDGQTSTSGSSGGTGTNGSYGGGAGGTNGGGGAAGAGAGAGTSGTNTSGGNGGIDNGTGGAGGGGGMGVGDVGATFLGGTAPGNTLGSSSKPGGFGGGGGCTIAEYGGRGGGGGYSGGGGGGGAAQGVGGGGGSYSAYSTNYNNNVGTNNGDGYITIISPSDLYTFSSHTFTNASATGRNGPTLSQCRAAYSSSTWTQDTINNWLNMTTQGIQLWKVPATGSYTFTIAGAKGGDAVNGYVGGQGRIVTITCNLTQNQILKIVVGQSGSSYSVEQTGGSGGGGTYVTLSDNTIIGIGGGGGGAKAVVYGNQNGQNAPAATYGLNSTGNPGATGGAGGTYQDLGYAGGGGGGFSTNGSGRNLNVDLPSLGGLSFANNSLGGYGYIYIIGGNGGADGGFGGGGGLWINNEARPGGGGGYSGGDGASYGDTSYGGGGGGSHLGSYTSITSSSYGGTNNGNGYVTITPNFTIIASAATWSVSSSDPIIGWVIGGSQYYAIPCNSAAEITQDWQYSISLGGFWSNFSSGTFVTVSGGVMFNNTVFSGYFMSSQWTTGNTNYYQRVGKGGTIYTTQELTAVNNRVFASY